MKKQILKLVAGALTGVIIFGLSAVAAGAFDFESFDFESFDSSASDSSAGSATDQGVSAYAEDTLAGFSTSLESSVVGANSRVIFELSKPDGNTVELQAIAGLDGVARLSVPDYHIRGSGLYSLKAKLQGDSQYGQASSFEVLSGGISEKYSSVTPLEQVVRLGREVGEVEVSLKDVFGNPIENHMVELISSRGSDVVNYESNYSDSSGRVLFSLSSTEPGLSSYTVYDLTANKILSERTKVVYFDNTDSLLGNNLGANVIGYDAGAASGPVAYLGFEDFPLTANTGQSLSFTLTAMDEAGETVLDYDGGIQFSVVTGDESKVSLPSDYTFTAQDLGSHPFPLSLSFNGAGNYVLEARDAADLTVYGTTSIEVTSAGGGAGSTINIANPIAGTYSNNVQVVSGTAAPVASLAIYDNNVKIGNATADVSGAFSFTTGLLTDGTHEFYIAVLNEAGVVQSSSSKVSVIVDTTAPEITNVEIAPAGVIAGGDVEIKLYSEENLSQVIGEVSGLVFELDYDEAGYYLGTLKAPIIPGEYSLKFTLVDQLGNEGKSEGDYSLDVSVTGSVDSGVGDVIGLLGVSGDHKVTLSWSPPSTGNPVQFYRIYYGISANQLKYAVDTWAATTTWYVPDLHNDTEYFFAVVAVDNAGNNSAHMSNIISVIPSESSFDGGGNDGPTDVWDGTAGGENLDDMGEDVSDSGPEIFWLFLSAILGGIFYSYTSNRQKTEEWKRY
jgi:hypothetical protein